MQRNLDKKRLQHLLIIASALVVGALMSAGFLLVRNKILSNAQEFGVQLVQSYATEEETYLDSYDLFIRYGARNLDEMIDHGTDTATMKAWLAAFTETAAKVMGSSSIEPFVVYNGALVSATDQSVPADYSYQDEPWYTEALAAGGEPIFTDAYTSVVSGKRIITVSMQLGHPGDVLAFDIQAPAVEDHREKTELPESTSYFLLDSSGALLTGNTDMDLWDDSTQEYLTTLFDAINASESDQGMIQMRDTGSSDRSVFYARLNNGWCSIITMPRDYILRSGWDRSFIFLAAVSGLLLLGLLVLFIVDRIRTASMRTKEKTLQIIGNSFYCILKINFVEGTYQTIKAAPDKARELGRKGSLEKLYASMRPLVDEATFEAFTQSFSEESLARLVTDRVTAFGGEFRRRFPDGERWVRVRVMADPDLNDNEVIMTFREFEEDMHKQRQRLELLESSLATAQEVAENQSAFFRNISHDMRTPLNGIIGMARLAEEGLDDPAKTRNCLDHVIDAAEQLRTLVNEILDLARLRASSSSVLEEAPFDIAKLVDRTVEFFAGEAASKNKTIGAQIDRDIPRWVVGDKGRLRQILNNLLSNALKYSFSGAGVSVLLSLVDANPDQNGQLLYRFVVADSGIGMTKEFLEKLFEPFAREEAFAPRDATGTGLGMPIVKNLVTQMGGHIEVESTLGKGSTFTITLPFRIAEQAGDGPAGAPDGAETPAAEGAAQAEARESGARDGEPRPIIYADDNELNRIIMDALLTELGYRPVAATNGAEALDAFKASEPGSVAAVLLDVQMPVMDGLETAQAIRALDRPDAAGIPLIAVTANAFPEDVARATNAGMTGYIVKPIDIDALRKALGR